MEEEKKKEQDEKGFVVKDRRFSARQEEQVSPPGKEDKAEATSEAPRSREEAPLPEVSFISFVLSLSTSALIHLGEIEDPVTQKTEKRLPHAKQTIDLLALLQEKTKGNLTQQEEKVIENILYDLRMRYVRAVS